MLYLGFATKGMPFFMVKVESFDDRTEEVTPQFYNNAPKVEASAETVCVGPRHLTRTVKKISLCDVRQTHATSILSSSAI